MIPENTDYSALRFYSDIFQFLLTGAIAVYLWFRDRRQVSKKKYEEQEKRITQLEQEIKRLPPCAHHNGLENNIQNLDRRMDAMHGEMKELVGTVKGINRAVDLMNEYLINNGGKS